MLIITRLPAVGGLRVGKLMTVEEALNKWMTCRCSESANGR